MEKKYMKHTLKDYFIPGNKAEFRDALQPFSFFLPEMFLYTVFNDASPVLFPQFNRKRGM